MRHVRRHIGEDRGPHVVAAVEALRPAGAAGDQRGALVDARLDQALDLVELDLADHRARAPCPWPSGSPTLMLLGGRLGDADGLVMPVARHEHAGRRVAGLAAVAEAAASTPLATAASKSASAQDDVGRLAAQLLGHALDRIGGGLGDQDAGAGRAGEGHHVDVGMAGDRLADRRPVAIDQVEHALRHAGLMHHLGEDERAHRRDLARLQHHGAARGERRRDLADDLVERPVPGRDQAARRRSARARSRVRAALLPRTRNSSRILMVGCRWASADAPPARAWARHIGAPISLEMASAISLMRWSGRPRGCGCSSSSRSSRLVREKAGKAALRRRHRPVDIGGGADGDRGEGFFRGRVDDVEGLGRHRVDPGAVDVEFQGIGHGYGPFAAGNEWGNLSARNMAQPAAIPK